MDQISENQNLSGKSGGIMVLASRHRLPLLYLLVALVVVLTGVFASVSWAVKEITLSVDSNEKILKTWSFTVGDLLEKENIVLGPNDAVMPALTEKIREGSVVEVIRSHKVTVTAQGQNHQLDTTAGTVGDAVEQMGIAINEGDIVQPGIGEKITGDTNIKITRVVTKEKLEKAEIAFNFRRTTNPDMDRGISKTIRKGKAGVEQQQWQVVYHDGQEVSRSMVDRKIVTPPVEEVLVVGSGQTVSRGGNNIKFERAMDVVATAYTYTGNNTASGRAPCYGVVAVDTSVIPMGSKLYIEGYGAATALDRGGAIRGNRIDVFLETTAQAKKWGVRKVRLYVLK